MKHLIAKVALLGALAVSMVGAVSASAADAKCCVPGAPCCHPGGICCK